MNAAINCGSKSGLNSLFAYLPFVNEQAMNNPFEIPNFNDIELFVNSMNAFHFHEQNFNSLKLTKENRNISNINTLIILPGKVKTCSPIACSIPSPLNISKITTLSENDKYPIHPLSINKNKDRIKYNRLSQENILGSINLYLNNSDVSNCSNSSDSSDSSNSSISSNNFNSNNNDKNPFKVSSVITYKEKGKCLLICNIIKILRKYFKLCEIPRKTKKLMKALRFESAKRLGMKKKTLDDYEMFLRWGIRLGFPFEEYMNKKFGFLRNWVKDNPNFTGKKTSLRYVFNSVNLIEEIKNIYTTYFKNKK